jgi:hypothetical protein
VTSLALNALASASLGGLGVGPLAPARNSLSEPDREALGVDFATGNREGHSLDVVVGGEQAPIIEFEKELGRHYSDALVPVHERVIHHERMHEGGGFARKIRIEVVTAKCRRRSRDRGFETGPISEPASSSESLDLNLVKVKNLLDREVDDHSASFR